MIKRINELEEQTLLDESELAESKMEDRTSKNIRKKLLREALLTTKIYSQKVEILQLKMYLLSIVNSIKEELKTFDSCHDGTCYRIEDIENMVKRLNA